MSTRPRQDKLLSPNAWTLKNANVIVGSGSVFTTDDMTSDEFLMQTIKLMELIHGEERKYLDSLEKFIRLNSDNFDAMDMYCNEASKYLPDEVLENKIYAYTTITHTPINLETFSKIKNKDKWSRLASKEILNGLLSLSDAPFGIISDFWVALSMWEDLDISRNSIDWYGFFQNSTFWYHPMFYVKPSIMPEAVFVKYLRQAERASDWKAVAEAAEARFADKKHCHNEWILKVWNQSEEKAKI